MSSAEELAHAYADISGVPGSWDTLDDVQKETATTLMERALERAGIAIEHQVYHPEGVHRPLREHEEPGTLSARLYAAGVRVRARLVSGWRELPPSA